MKRWAFNIIAAGSLALGVLTAGLWVRGYSRMDAVSHDQQEGFLQIGNLKGWLWVWRHDYGVRTERVGWFYKETSADNPLPLLGPPDRQFGPVRAWHWPGYNVVAVPHWSLVLLFSLPPAAWLLRGPLLRRRRVKLGLCRHCGYDLRASPERCPECGRENSPSPLIGDCTLRGPASRNYESRASG